MYNITLKILKTTTNVEVNNLECLVNYLIHLRNN
jgi:hypothetical protein